MSMTKYYSGGPVHIYIQSLINIMKEKNCVITTKNGKGKLSLFCGNGEQVIPIYDGRDGNGANFLHLSSTPGATTILPISLYDSLLLLLLLLLLGQPP